MDFVPLHLRRLDEHARIEVDSARDLKLSLLSMLQTDLTRNLNIATHRPVNLLY